MLDGFDYIAEANLTLSNQFHGDKVAFAELKRRLWQFAQTGNQLDEVKKAIFYGKGDGVGNSRGHGVDTAEMAVAALCGKGLTTEEAETVIHGVIGIATEAAELVEALLTAVYTDKPIDGINMLEEVGDQFWYQAILLKTLGSTFDNEQRRNIAKLRERFPNKFTEYDAINRDLGNERSTLELFGETMPVDKAVALFGADEFTDCKCGCADGAPNATTGGQGFD
jgi:NTP pyrophosphatase (non-canonical NTP hydrolase)